MAVRSSLRRPIVSKFVEVRSVGGPDGTYMVQEHLVDEHPDWYERVNDVPEGSAAPAADADVPAVEDH